MDLILKEWAKGLNDSKKLIVVEGIKDRRALQDLGIKNEILVLNKPLDAVAEEAARIEKEVVLLTDFDSKGKELYGKLKRDLVKLGVKVDAYFREWLQKNTKLSHVEGIDSYFKNNYVM